MRNLHVSDNLSMLLNVQQFLFVSEFAMTTLRKAQLEPQNSSHMFHSH